MWSILRAGLQNKAYPVHHHGIDEQRSGRDHHDEQRNPAGRKWQQMQQAHEQCPTKVGETLHGCIAHIPNEAEARGQMLGIAHADHGVVNEREIGPPLESERKFWQ